MANPFLSIKEVVLVANVSQAISPPRPASMVTVMNPSAADLSVYSEQDDTSTRLTVPAGWERQLPLGRGQNYYPGQTAFYLKSTINATIELIWT